jgi:hypothetical protein
MRVLVLAVVLVLLLAGCGGSSKTLSSASQADAYVKNLVGRGCHLKVARVECRDRGTVWDCQWSTSGSLPFAGGGLQLKKHLTGRRSLAC